MPAWLKVVLIALGAIVLLVVLAGFIGYRWLKSHSTELRAERLKIKAEATEFGRGKAPDACVNETFARMDRCDGIICEAKTKIFLKDCVAAADVPQDFCAAIPRRTEIFATAQWAIAECARRGRSGDQRCTRAISGLQEYCAR